MSGKKFLEVSPLEGLLQQNYPIHGRISFERDAAPGAESVTYIKYQQERAIGQVRPTLPSAATEGRVVFLNRR